MPRAMHIVRCNTCASEQDELVTFPDAPGAPQFEVSACVSCGGPRQVRISYSQEAKRADAFSPIDFNGTRYETRADWESFRAEYKEIHGEELHVVGMTPRQKKQMIEDRLMHNVEVLRRQEKRCGVDYSGRIQQLKECAHRIMHS